MISANAAELAWCDVTRRGYNVVKLSPARAETSFIQLAQVSSKERPAKTVKTLVSETRNGSGVGAWTA